MIRMARSCATSRRLRTPRLRPKSKEIALNVTIEETAFEGQPAQKIDGIKEMVFNNTDLLRNLGGAVIALVLFAFFLRMLKRTKPDEIPFELLQPAAAAVVAVSEKPVPITPDMLNAMIRQKPANVGAALRGWMVNGTATNKS